MLVVAVVSICAAALLISALSLAAAFAYRKYLEIPRNSLTASVTLILPLTGPAKGLERLLLALDSQTLLPRRLLIAVETDQDPAYLRAIQLSKSCAFSVEVVLAGLANSCAQKCRNQIMALRRVDTMDQAVVFLDADIVPQAWWLSAVVTPLLDGSADIVSGYRWPMVERLKLGAHLVAAIDRSIAVLPRFSWTKPTWGGTLGFTPGALRALDLEKTLSNTLSDDCTIGDHAATLGLRVLMRRALLVPTPLHSACVSAWRFGRRQKQIIRIYRPKLWWLAFVAITVRLIAWAIIIGHCASSTWALATGAGLIALSIAGTRVQQHIARQLDCADPPGVRRIQFALAIAKPLVDVFYWSMIVGAIRTRSVVWGHVRYKVSGPTSIQVEHRAAWS